MHDNTVLPLLKEVTFRKFKLLLHIIWTLHYTTHTEPISYPTRDTGFSMRMKCNFNKMLFLGKALLNITVIIPTHSSFTIKSSYFCLD